ncbi:sensor histidine kinase, partial [Streptomyces scabiei]|nr:sensor histidine kinase [Streptomyces scabiei]MDX3152775.1 sensor histidine kinase [Streptomyces scabiei]MDX3161061.1 sensor histidine kinase [Streptomyces scabiei]MDX3465991.1 sensor histidine kinase [Streptomyces scabiei]MDX3482582.1 sensor histidine kinase [Streptomyces scabiei]
PPATSTTPNGLRGLTERLAAAGGTLRAGPAPCGGFEVSAELPVTAPLVTPREACDATSAWAAPGAERERHP